MNLDLWFCRIDGQLYAVTSKPGEPPHRRAVRRNDVGETIKSLRAKGNTIEMVGILDPKTMGLL